MSFLVLPTRLIKKLNSYLLISLLLTFSVTSQSSSRYYLCGPDEDGCSEDIYPYCLCIPYDDIHANQPYCLDVEQLTCAPLVEKPECNPEYIYPNQGECFAIIFQSEPTPPCTITTHSFCLEHNMSICAPDGNPRNCHQYSL